MVNDIVPLGLLYHVYSILDAQGSKLSERDRVQIFPDKGGGSHFLKLSSSLPRVMNTINILMISVVGGKLLG